MINNTLIQEIKTILGSAISPSLRTSSDTSDIFEAYVFSLVIDAARTEHGNILFRDVNGQYPSVFVFRTSPGYIFSTERAYTHAVISFPGKPPLEAHLGVRVVGNSGVLHECDVAVINQDEAEMCRRNHNPPRSRELIIAVECKFYSTSLQLHLARAFIGLTSDLSSKNLFFVTNTGSTSIEKLLTYRGKSWENNLYPGSNVEVDRMRNNFQEAFKKYKAR